MVIGKKEKKLIVFSIILFAVIILGWIGINFISNMHSLFPPHIDTNNKEIEELNSYFKQLYSDIKKDKNQKVTYRSNKYNNYLSIVLKITNSKTQDVNYYLSYVIDVNKDIILSDQDIMEIFNYDSIYVERKILNQLETYMYDEIDQNYIDSDDFDIYITQYRNIDLLDFNSYYTLSIENGNLVAYLNMNKQGFDSREYPYFLQLDNEYQRIEIN